MVSQLRGVQEVEGRLTVVTVQDTPQGRTHTTMPIEEAHAIGCILIELCQLAKERQQQLRATGELLDVAVMREEFAERLRRRETLNGGNEAVDWATLIR